MKKTIKKTDLRTDITDFMIGRSVGNKKAKTYHYAAKLTNYISGHNIKRDFLSRCTEFESYDDGWSFYISTAILNLLIVGDVVEIKLNRRESNKYSFVACIYFVVIKNNSDVIVVDLQDTAYKAFKSSNKIQSPEENVSY
jgi:hypothetical protein